MSGCPVKGVDGDGEKSMSCPVQSKSSSSNADRSYWQYWASWFAAPRPLNETPVPGQDKYNPLINDINFGQERQPQQTIPLSTSRAVSSIPKGELNPHHQIASLDQWVYPSEQQYYNAMKVCNPTLCPAIKMLILHVRKRAIIPRLKMFPSFLRFTTWSMSRAGRR